MYLVDPRITTDPHDSSNTYLSYTAMWYIILCFFLNILIIFHYKSSLLLTPTFSPYLCLTFLN